MEKKPLWLEKSLSTIVKLSLKIQTKKEESNDLPPSLKLIENEIFERIGSLFLEETTENGIKYECLICHRKGLTRIGLYHHFMNSHRERIEKEIVDVIEKRFEATKKGR